MSTYNLKQALEIVYGDIKNINKRVVNLESASAGVLYNETTKSAVAYQDNVSANACPYALLNKVGGMSYKSLNIYNQEWELGAIDYNTGAEVATTNSIRSKWVKVEPNTTYYFYCGSISSEIAYWIIGYDNSQNYISGLKSTASSNGTFTTPNNCYYIRFRFNSGYGATYNNDACINISNNTINGNYYPYFDDIRDTAVSSAVLRGANLIDLQDVSETTSRGLTYKVENGKLTVNATSLTGNVTLFLTLKTPITIDPNSSYSSLSGVEINKPMQWYLTSNSSASADTYRSANRFIVNGKSSGNVNLSNSAGNNTYTQVYIYINNDATFDNFTYTPMLVEGSTSPTTYIPYMTPITKVIPQEIQALEGYGWGINDTCYNYIDFENKKFIQKVGTRAYQSGDEEDTSVLTDLTITYYELATPIETDISQYINDNSIQIEANGTITFNNTYEQAIPYEYLYLEKVGANNE